MFQIMQQIQEKEPEAHIIYINKEDLAFDHLQTATDLQEYVLDKRVKTGMSYVFIDEIQEIQSYEYIVKCASIKML